MDKIPLSLSEQGKATRKPVPKTPLSGYLAAGFGLLFSLIALLRGQGMWALVGLMLTIGGILGSPILMGLIGLGALYVTFYWQEMLRPLYEFIGGGVDI